MLNEAPKKKKKEKDYSNPTKWQLFWRIQRECLRRSVTAFLMYMFMSMLALACMALGKNAGFALQLILTLICIVGGAFYNGHLCYHFGKMHYGFFASGELHRRNEKFGIVSGGDHRPEREYRPWKGFLIGLYIGLPVVLLSVIAGSIEFSAAWMYVQYAFMMFAGWALIPMTWFGYAEGGGLNASMYWAALFALLPIIVSGIFYIVGAFAERRTREEEAARAEEIEAAGKNARKKNTK